MKVERVPDKLLLLGATGDLAGRLLFPALAALRANGDLIDLRIVGAAPDDLDVVSFRQHVDEQLARHARDLARATRDDLLRSTSYVRVDLDDPATVARAIGGGEPICVYLAIPPQLFATAIEALAANDLPDGSRIAIEKPFGHDLVAARSLNGSLERLTGKKTVFRVDHVLGMPALGNLLGIRLASPVFEPVWNSEHIEQVNVLWEETIALEGRADFYDKTGALKDVVQNHVLQILSMIAMEPPTAPTSEQMAVRKLDALRAIRRMTVEDVVSGTRRARYAAGRLANSGGADGREVPAFTAEDGVDPSRNTETFVEIALQIDNERWEGTRFVLRAGKALGARRKGVEVLFRPSALPGSEDGPSLLWIGVDGPTNVSVQWPDGEVGPPPDLTPVTLLGDKDSDPELPAYAHVLRDILSGTDNLSVRGAEAEEAWHVMTPVIEGWSRDLVPLEEYAAGSTGP